LREHASERERLAIAARYYPNVTGEQDKAAKVYQELELVENYPRDYAQHNNLGIVYTAFEQFEKAVDAYRQSIRLTIILMHPARTETSLTASLR
jgi:tetratricopeptide (TPR) repeat protein